MYHSQILVHLSVNLCTIQAGQIVFRYLLNYLLEYGIESMNEIVLYFINIEWCS